MIQILRSELLAHFVLQTIAMCLTAAVLPKLRVTSIFGAAAMVAGLAIVNSTLWDAALFFTIPDSLSTHALLLLLANGAVFWVLVKLLPGVEVEGFFTALLAPVLFTVISLLAYTYGRHVDWLGAAQYVLEHILRVRDYFRSPEASPLRVPVRTTAI